MRLEVRLGNVEFLSAPRDGAGLNGLFIEKDGLQGWDDGVTVRGDSAPIPAGHGEFDLPVFRGGRVLTLSGWAVARNLYDLGKLRAQIMGIGGAGGLVPIIARHQSEWLQASGRLAPGATPTFRDTGAPGHRARARFELQLVCRDPRKYGTVRTFRAGERTVQRGNFPAVPTLLVTRVSGSGGYTITAGAGRVVVSQALAVGASHRIDLRTGGLYSGSKRIVGGLTTFRPWEISPNDAGTTHTVSAGIDLRVEVADTYI